MNWNFAKTEDGKNLLFAPSEFDYKGVHYNATNNERIYNDIGYFRLARTEAPIAEEGFYFEPYYVLENNVLLERWEEHEIPQEERFGKEEIENAIKKGVNSIDC